MTSRRLNPTEAQVQEAVVAWCRSQAVTRPGMERIVHVPNGAHFAGDPEQRARQMARLKKAGLAVGYPDLVLDLARGGWHGLRIEMKAKGGRPSDGQEEWLSWLNSQGYKAVVCWTYEQAVEALAWYYDGELTRRAPC